MFSLTEEALTYTLTLNFWRSSKSCQSYESSKTEMHSTLEPQDPFNFNHCTGVQARTLHIKDFIYMLNLYGFLRNFFGVDAHDN